MAGEKSTGMRVGAVVSRPIFAIETGPLDCVSCAVDGDWLQAAPATEKNRRDRATIRFMDSQDPNRFTPVRVLSAKTRNRTRSPSDSRSGRTRRRDRLSYS